MNSPLALPLRHRFGRTLLAAAIALVAVPALAQEAGGVSPVALVSRWAHIVSAIIMLGGAFFIRFMLMPAVTEAFGADGHGTLRPALMKRWKKVVYLCTTLFLVSGFYNYLVVTRPAQEGNSLYHALFGIKFLLAMAVFFFAMVLTSTKDKPSRLRDNAPLWLGVTVALGIVVTLIAGYMKLA